MGDRLDIWQPWQRHVNCRVVFGEVVPKRVAVGSPDGAQLVADGRDRIVAQLSVEIAFAAEWIEVGCGGPLAGEPAVEAAEHLLGVSDRDRRAAAPAERLDVGAKHRIH